MTKVYLAGPMSGYPSCNHKEFARVTSILREAGYEVFSPAEYDAKSGFNPDTDKQKPFKHYMQVDLPEVMNAEAVILLKGWEKSKGANLEVKVAKECDIPIFEFFEKDDKNWKVVLLQDLSPAYTKNIKKNIREAASWDKMSQLPKGEVRITDPTTGGAKGIKPARFGLIPSEALWQLAELYGRGSQKYDDHNWRRGYKWSLSYDALQRHANLFWQGEEYDEETKCHHMASVAFHAFALMTFCREHPELDDRFLVNRP